MHTNTEDERAVVAVSLSACPLRRRRRDGRGGVKGCSSLPRASSMPSALRARAVFAPGREEDTWRRGARDGVARRARTSPRAPIASHRHDVVGDASIMRCHRLLHGAPPPTPTPARRALLARRLGRAGHVGPRRLAAAAVRPRARRSAAVRRGRRLAIGADTHAPCFNELRIGEERRGEERRGELLLLLLMLMLRVCVRAAGDAAFRSGRLVCV